MIKFKHKKEDLIKTLINDIKLLTDSQEDLWKHINDSDENIVRLHRILIELKTTYDNHIHPTSNYAFRTGKPNNRVIVTDLKYKN